MRCNDQNSPGKRIATLPALASGLFFFLAAIPLLAVAIPAIAIAQSNPAARKLYYEGNRKLRDGLLEEAVRKYDEAIDIEKHEFYYYQRGVAFRRSGRPAQSEVSFREALRLKPDLGPAHQGLGAALAAQQRYPEAIACYEKALSMNPELGPAKLGLAAARSGLALALLDSGKYSMAVETARAAMAADSSLPQPRLAIARAHTMTGRPDEAIREAEYVLSAFPEHHADACYELALAHKAAGNDYAAMRYFEQARSSPRHAASAEHQLKLLDSLRTKTDADK